MTAPRVFLTGFPGFLGSALIERVLERGDGPVACLVQPHHRAQAEDRARELVDAVDAPAVGDDRIDIRLYDGDITDPDLGLEVDRATFDAIESCYHLAAIYDLGVDLEPAEAVNVRGTERVLEFAASIDVDRFHYVSTCYVSGRYDGVFTETHLAEGQSFNNHYEETKYRAEVAVQRRMAAGFPATVYRPAIVVGDSETGETEKYDGPYYQLRHLLSQPEWLSVSVTVPGARSAELNVVPRDYVVDAIDALSARADTVGEVYQLCDPAPLPVRRFAAVLADAIDHRTVPLPVPKSIARRGLDWLESRGASVEPATLDYLDHPTRYACPKTRRALADTAVEVPPFESYVDALVDFVREHPDLRDSAMR
ncbi:SDR family oxidoreductase [Halovivax limisalsi]|uniref:SDR family oxidoreductase n=1 Tax=Halovivax limisalsi TaxID=1453760 RepID=UPI001FFDD80D|nr:SDR family oxidoreductase [Halovivax limisalsi]